MAIDSYIQMKLYTLTKRQFLFLFLSFFVFFLVSIFVGWLGPSVINVISVDQGIETTDNKISMLSPDVTPSEQQLWLQIETLFNGDRVKGPTFEKISYLTVPMKVKVYSYENGTKGFLNDGAEAHNRTLKCFETKCSPVTVLHIGNIKFPQYYVEIEMSQALVNGSSFKPVWTTYNSHFTEFELWFRFIFLLLAFGSSVALCQSLRKYSVEEWSIEQKWIMVLLTAVLLYNNPLFPLILLVHSPLVNVIDDCFTVTFFCTLLMFWLCVYHGIRKTERHFFSFYLVKMVLVGLMWVIGCVILSWSALYQSIDPTYSLAQDQVGFLSIKIIFFVLLGIYTLYLLYLLVRAYSELHSMPYFDIRLRFLTALTIIILLISLLAVIIRFGNAFLEDVLVMQITLRWNNSAEFLSFYSLFNSYLFTLAFVYSPSNTAVSFKDQTSASFAMLSDSEDELLYRGKKFVNGSSTNYDEGEESM